MLKSQNKTPEELQSIVAATMEAGDADLRKRYEQLCDRIVAGIYVLSSRKIFIR